MVVNIYVRQMGGSDDADGSSYYSAFRTITKAAEYVRNNVSNGDPCIIHVYPGYYFGSGFELKAPLNTNPSTIALVGYGEVIVMPTSTISWQHRTIFSGINFENWSKYLLAPPSDAEALFYQCCFSAKTRFYQKIDIAPNVQSMGVRFTECTFYGLNSVSIPSTPATTTDGDVDSLISKSIIYNCVSVSCDNISGCGSDLQSIYDLESCFNATESGKEPPFNDYSTPSDADVVMDLSHANFAFYKNASPDGGMVGAIGRNTTGWSENTDSLVLNGVEPNNTLTTETGGGKASAFLAWENDINYYDDTWADVVITTGSNDQLTIERPSGNNLTITMTGKTYLSSQEIATEIANQLNLSDTEGNTYTVNADTRDRLTIACDTTPFKLLVQSEPSASPAWSTIGFGNTGADRTGSSEYTSEHPIRVGPSAGAEDFATISIVDSANGIITIDRGFEDGGNNARAISDVVSYGEPVGFKGALVEFFAVGDRSAIDSTPLNTSRTVEVRASNSLFNKNSPGGTTSMDWTHVDANMIDPLISDRYRFWQFRIHLRTNAVI